MYNKTRSTTTNATITIGFISGYGGDRMLHQYEKMDSGHVAKLFQTISYDVFKETGVYVSGVGNLSQAIYNPEWGCPNGGEPTYTISCLRNPKFNKSDVVWRNCVEMITERLASALKQHSVSLMFQNVIMVYYNKKEEE